MKKLLFVFILGLIITLATAISVLALSRSVDSSEGTSASVVTIAEEDSSGSTGAKTLGDSYDHGAVCGLVY